MKTISKIKYYNKEIELPIPIEVNEVNITVESEEYYFHIFETIVEAWKQDKNKLKIYEDILKGKTNIVDLVNKILDLEEIDF